MTNDLFKQPTGGGAYPKMDDLENHLVLLKPSKVETVPGYQGKGTTERITADCWVFGDDLDPAAVEKYDDMYFSQAGIVPGCKQSLKPDGTPYVLGVVEKFPSKNAKKDGITTPAEVNAALAEWLRKGGKGEKPQFAWGLGEYTEAQGAAALALIQSFTQPANPFEQPTG